MFESFCTIATPVTCWGKYIIRNPTVTCNTFCITIWLSLFAIERRTDALWVQVGSTPRRSGGFDVLPGHVTCDCSPKSCPDLRLSIDSVSMVHSGSCMSSNSNIGVVPGAAFSGGGAVAGVVVKSGAVGFSGTCRVSGGSTLGYQFLKDLVNGVICLTGILYGSNRFRCNTLSFPPPSGLTAYTGGNLCMHFSNNNIWRGFPSILQFILASRA